MKKSLTWCDKYEIALKESLSIRDIQNLRSIGTVSAMKIRKEVVEYCLKNNIEIGANLVPTEIVFMITNRDLGFYYDKMLKEVEMLQLRHSYV